MHKNNIIILGLGNEYISDDGIGILTARELKQREFFKNVRIEELAFGGLALLDYFIGYHKAIIIDAFVTGNYPAGTIYRYRQLCNSEIEKIKSSHQVDLQQVIGLAKALKLNIPSEVIVYGIEASDITTFKSSCSLPVEMAIPKLAALVEKELSNRYIITKSFEIVN
ncbi:MAG: hydrogenase maturation protease [Bacteroidota bacterium]|nr:hydrogenase maturation protease [Bacteroidota bacterium]